MNIPTVSVDYVMMLQAAATLDDPYAAPALRDDVAEADRSASATSHHTPFLSHFKDD